jgi:hypothetical protein
LDAVEVDLSKSFEKGMGYVALSRVRSLDGLTLLGLNDIAVQVRGEVLDFDEQIKKISNKHLAEMHSLTKAEKDKKQTEFLKRISPDRTASGKIKKIKISTFDETRKMFEAGMNLNEIANGRGLSIKTIFDHIEKLLEEDSHLDIRQLEGEISINKFKKIYKAFNDIYGKNRELRLTPVMKLLGDEKSGCTFEDLRLVRLFLKKKGM